MSFPISTHQFSLLNAFEGQGGKKATGMNSFAGAKNEALTIISAVLRQPEPGTISNIPDISMCKPDHRTAGRRWR